MLLYVFAIWLVSFYSSSGAPTLKPVSQESALSALNATIQPLTLATLANSCGNPFLSAQIKSKIPDCPELVSPSSEKQFQCMLFYDINRQLCAAVTSSKIALNEDYTAKIEASQEVTQLCKAAQGWTYTDLGEVYKKNVKLVFENVIRCVKTCSADYTNILNMESNFYCRYFKWGTEMLKSQDSTPAHVEAAPGSVPEVAVPGNLSDPKSVVPKPDIPAPVVLPVTGPQVKDVSKPDNIPVPSNIKSQLQSSSPHDAKTETQQAASDKSTSTKPSSTSKANEETPIVESVPEATLNADSAPAIEENKGKSEDNTGVNKNSGVSGEEQRNKPVQDKGSEPDAAKKSEADKPANVDGKSKANGEKIDQPPKLVNDQIQLPDEYQSEMDSDEGRGLSDTQGGDDGDDLALGDNEQQDMDVADINIAKKVETQFTNDLNQKEYYPNADGFVEEDDHFFPFFLTAIIMVVLLYVLYHNKSKVSKVIMGLIVEGRQPGRRRNSRGHAYKRLDTLEQAMSTNTAAPPSKIIY